MSNLIAIVIISVVALTVIILLILKNKRDKKSLNLDAQDSVKEVKRDHDRRRDKM